MKTRTTFFLGALLVAVAAPASAQSGTWSAWHGCWSATGEDAPVGQMLCMLPGTEPTTVRIVLLQDGAVATETTVRADGVARPVDEGGCKGEEKAFFSRDGRRVFTRAELDCGSGMTRISTGIIGMVSEVEWVDAQAMSVDEQHATRIMRYRALPITASVPASIAAQLPQGRELAQEAARLHAAAPLELDNITEASAIVAAPAVEALLAARNHGFGLNAEKLLALRAAGVPGSTIDLMVALSYPAKFAVTERPRRDDETADWRGARGSWLDDCYDPFWTVRRYRASCSRYGYGYGYGYDRYGYSMYSPWGYDPYGWRYGRDPIIVIVDPDFESDGGEVIKGQGYTRGQTSTRGTATRGDSRTGSGSAGARSTPTRTSGSAERPTSTGTSTTPVRTAKPRPGGGGGGN